MANDVIFAGLMKGFTLPVVRPEVNGDRDNAVSGVAVSAGIVKGRPHILVTLRHPDGATLTGMFDDSAMIRFTRLLLEADTDPNCAVSPDAPGVAH